MEVFWSISLQKWWKSNFSLQSQYIDKQTDNENKEYYDHRNSAANVYGVGWRKLHVCKKKRKYNKRRFSIYQTFNFSFLFSGFLKNQPIVGR